MTPFLLSSQSVFDIVKYQGLPAELWLEAMIKDGVPEDDICISAVVPMVVLRGINTQIAIAQSKKSNELAGLVTMQMNAQKYLATFQQKDRIVSMDEHIAKRWGVLLDMELTYTSPSGMFYEVGSSEKVELATASVGRHGYRFFYVDRRQHAHQFIPDLVLECPFEFVKTIKT